MRGWFVLAWLIFTTLVAFWMGFYLVANPAGFKRRFMAESSISHPIFLHFLRGTGAVILVLWGFLFYKAFTL